MRKGCWLSPCFPKAFCMCSAGFWRGWGSWSLRKGPGMGSARWEQPGSGGRGHRGRCSASGTMPGVPAVPHRPSQLCTDRINRPASAPEGETACSVIFLIALGCVGHLCTQSRGWVGNNSPVALGWSGWEELQEEGEDACAQCWEGRPVLGQLGAGSEVPDPFSSPL